MAAQWADIPSGDLGLYDGTTAKMLDGIWAEVANSDLKYDPDPSITTTGRCVQLGGNANSGGGIRKVLTGPRDTVGMACRLWLDNLPTSNNVRPGPFNFQNDANTVICRTLINTTGTISVLNAAGTVLGTSSVPVITANAWTHLSCKATFAGASGAVSIEREGLPVLTLTGINIGSAQCPQVYFINNGDVTGASTTTYVKDLFIWDGLGTVNNDHSGPVSVYRRKVVADVSSGWSKSAGATEYGLLDETPPDDADFIYANKTLPAASILELQDLPEDVVSVRAVFMVGRMQKSDGGDCKVQMSMTPNAGVDYATGADRAITTAYTYWFDAVELSPDTGLPMTPIEFNASRIKTNRTL